MSHGFHGLYTDGIRYKNYNKFDQKLSKISMIMFEDNFINKASININFFFNDNWRQFRHQL